MSEFSLKSNTGRDLFSKDFSKAETVYRMFHKFSNHSWEKDGLLLILCTNVCQCLDTFYFHHKMEWLFRDETYVEVSHIQHMIVCEGQRSFSKEETQSILDGFELVQKLFYE